ncbi:hypothetical protein RUMTOR_00421 [[Ruminococcus] torques ATCC 27756]|uniref:Uncharacterized protein n=1 Tax=[Ruminococcus] torques ATCC 27756 TaxID=411460 RepID=A5KJM3_9FIRM|nr:hypothetical protein RUMTOR_00421 [[Ruminococcus] torques ATCC 27756]
MRIEFRRLDDLKQSSTQKKAGGEQKTEIQTF